MLNKLLALFCLTLAVSCGPIDTVEVKWLPVFSYNDQSKDSRFAMPANYMSDGNIFFEFYLYLTSPILFGMEANTSGYKIGDTITYDIAGDTLSVTISFDDATNEIVYTGTFAVGASNLTLAIDTDTNKFDYSQFLIMQDPDNVLTPPYGVIGFDASNVQMDSNGYYHFISGVKALYPDDFSIGYVEMYNGLANSDHPESGGNGVYGVCVKTVGSYTPDAGVTALLTAKNPLTFTLSEFSSYFTDCDSWTQNSLGIIVYYDKNLLNYFSTIVPPFIDPGHLASACPWDLLP